MVELMIKEGIEDNTNIFFFNFSNLCCDPLLEPSRRDGSNDGSQICFMGKYG